MSDKAASVFRTRPYCLDESAFDEELTLRSYARDSVLLYDPATTSSDGSFEKRILIGCRLIRQIWSSGASLLRRIRSFQFGGSEGDVLPLAHVSIWSS